MIQEEPHRENKRLYALDEVAVGPEEAPKRWQFKRVEENNSAWKQVEGPHWVKELEYRRDPDAPPLPSLDNQIVEREQQKMTDFQFLKELVERTETAEWCYVEMAHVIACFLKKSQRDQLIQLVNGPVWDGDVIGKDSRNALLSMGLAVRVCCNGESGYTGATYTAYTVARKIIDKEKGTGDD